MLDICWNSHELHRLGSHFPKVSIIVIIIPEVKNQNERTGNLSLGAFDIWHCFSFIRNFSMQFEHGWSVLHQALLDNIELYMKFQFENTWKVQYWRVLCILWKSSVVCFLIVKQSAATVVPLLTGVWQEVEGGLLVFQRSLQTLFWSFLFLVWCTNSYQTLNKLILTFNQLRF